MDSTDLPAPEQEPADPANCRVRTTVRVGPAGDDSGDDFTLFFVTPAWLARNLGADDFRVLEYTVVLSRFQWPVAERAARELVASTEPQSWEQFVDAFSRIAYWEYSDETPPAW
jgi:hypothetical protein